MKTCTKCCEAKDVVEFSKKLEGLQPHCKSCVSVVNATRYAANPEKAKAYNAKCHAANPEKRKVIAAKSYIKNRTKDSANRAVRYAENPEKVLAQSAKWYAENRDRVRANQATYRASGYVEPPGARAAIRAKRRAKELHATPVWAEVAAIKALYAARPDGHHVDHIVPLQGKNVCGLHVFNNLQYLTATENWSKGNRFENTISPRPNGN